MILVLFFWEIFVTKAHSLLSAFKKSMVRGTGQFSQWVEAVAAFPKELFIVV